MPAGSHVERPAGATEGGAGNGAGRWTVDHTHSLQCKAEKDGPGKDWKQEHLPTMQERVRDRHPRATPASGKEGRVGSRCGEGQRRWNRARGDSVGNAAGQTARDQILSG